MNTLDKGNKLRTPLAAVIMAAGKGTRMRNPDKAKVMFSVGGLPMVHHVINQAKNSGAERVIVIVGFCKDDVKDYIRSQFSDTVQTVEQNQQLGTGHAVLQALPALAGFQGDVLVLSGDVPLLSSNTITSLRNYHNSQGASATILSVSCSNPTGYGRIVRDENNSVLKIVEQKDANELELKISEINSGIYLFNCSDLVSTLTKVQNNNAQNEYYLTDVIGILVGLGKTVSAYLSNDFAEIQGVNTPEHLAEVEFAFSLR